MGLPHTETTSPGFSDTTGQPSASASGARLQVEFDKLFENDLVLGGRTDKQSNVASVTTFVDTVRAQTFDATSQVLLPNGGTIRMTGTAKIEQDGVPVAGYYVDGTPFFFKEISATISGLETASVAHGISDATTNRRIRLAIPSVNFSGPIYLQGASPPLIAEKAPHITAEWNDTNLTIKWIGSISSTDIFVQVMYV